MVERANSKVMLLCLQGWAKPETIDERKDACRPFLYSYNLELVRPYLMYELLVMLGLRRECVCVALSLTWRVSWC